MWWKSRSSKGSFFKIYTVFIFQSFSWTGKCTLYVAFVTFFCNFLLLVTLLKLYSYCTQTCNFYYFLGTRICFVTKELFNIFLGLCIYFFKKSLEIIQENHSLKSFRTGYDTLCHLVYKMFPLIFSDLILA